MKVEVEVKITILEGKEEGKTFVEKTIADTEQRYMIISFFEEDDFKNITKIIDKHIS